MILTVKKIKLAFILYNQEMLPRVVTQEGGKKMNEFYNGFG